MLTAYAQGWLPDQAAVGELRGPWALVAVALALRATTTVGAVLAAPAALLAGSAPRPRGLVGAAGTGAAR